MLKFFTAKRTLLSLVLSMFVVSNILGVFIFTPEKIIKAQEVVNEISFSHAAGFYTTDISLEITSQDGNIIYYTTDGTNPNLNSNVYENPISIIEEYIEPNYSTQIIDENTTPQYPLSFIMTNPPDAKDNYIWFAPQKNIFKATVVKAASYSEETGFSDVFTRSYFISDNMFSKYALPVISISLEVDDFFSYDRGIYVPGHHYYINGFGDDWWGRNNANYFQRGEDWERQVFVEFFEPDGTLGFSQIMGARMHGAGSRALPQKSIRLYARSDYDTDNSAIDYDVFQGLVKHGDGTPLTRFKRLILRNGGQLFYENLINDSLSQSLVAHTSVYTQSYRPANVFLNGEYWGIHFIMERLDSRYFESHYNLERDEIVIIDNDADLSHGVEGDEKHFLEMRNYIESNVMSNPVHYAYVNTQMDVENFIEYQIIQIFTGNYDWPGNNVKFWRTRNDYDENAPYYNDGRWRWIAFDMDFTYGFHNQTDNSMLHATKYNGSDWPNPDWSTVIFRSLLANEDFKIMFIQKFTDAMNTYLSKERIEEFINNMESELLPDLEEHIDRFVKYPEPTVGRWENNIRVVRSYANTRKSIMLRELQAYFKLNRPLFLTFDVSDTAHGLIEINNNLLSPETPGFEHIIYPHNANYFPDIPLTLTAVPNKGYKFVRWEGIEEMENESAATITFYPQTEKQEIKAVFEKGISISVTNDSKTIIALSLIGVVLIVLVLFFIAGNRKKAKF